MTSMRDDHFVFHFKNMQASAAAINFRNGFTAEESLLNQFEKFLLTEASDALRDTYAPLLPAFRNARVGLKLMLITGELGEMLEAIRKNQATAPDPHCPDFTNEEVELADVILRAMNYAFDRKLRLAEAIAAKNDFNLNRADHQPENRAAEHGKKF